MTKVLAKVDNTAEELIKQAITANVPVETMERLLMMRTQIKAERALEAFNASMAAFQSDCPTIKKTKEVFTRSGGSAYKYAPIESIVAQVKSLIQKHGFSYSFQQELKEGGVKVTCSVVHELGHMEEYSMEVPFGSKTQIMSDSQVVAAASTFAKRYAFCNAFGILTGDEDNDGAAFDTSPVPDTAKPVLYVEETEAEYDDPSLMDDLPKKATPINATPWRSPNSPSLMNKDERKRTIKELCDKLSLDKLSTKKDYEDFVRDHTQLNLIDANHVRIIELLRDEITKDGHAEE